MIHFNGDERASLAGFAVIAALCFLSVVIADHTEIGHRLRQAGHLLAEAGPWLVGAVLDVMARQRDFTVPASHPAGSARCTCWGCISDAPADPAEWADWYALEQTHPAPGREQ
jgi:hypothetical protein